MAWLPNYGHGPGEIASQFNVSSHGGGQVVRNQFADLIDKLAPAIQQYIKTKRNDAIANQIMNQWQPPRAEAVDPSLQGAPASDPFTGGADGLAAYQMYQKMQNQQEDQSLQRRATEARINQYGEDGLTPYQRRSLEIQEDREGRLAGGNKGGNSGYAKQFNASVGDEGITADDMAGIDTTTPDVVQYYKYVDQKPVKISTEEAKALGSNAYARAPGLPEVPLPKWNRAVQAYQRMVGVGQGGTEVPAAVEPKVMGKPTDPPAAGTSDNDAVLRDARDAIKRGKDPEAVKKRLVELGVDPAGL